MPKRKRQEKDLEELENKIKRYQDRLERWRDRDRSASPAPVLDRTPSPTPAQSPTQSPKEPRTETENDCPERETNVPNQEQESEGVTLDEEILALLGDAPSANQYGPAIHNELSKRWADIIKNGLQKEKKTELKGKYLAPENCKTIDAPKLNLEAQAAITDIAVKRDKAMANKQNQIGCALTGLARAFEKLINMNKENVQIQAINHISDAARLLCDLQHQESLTRRNFVLQGLDQSIRDSIKDAEVDQWLFGETFADKLKASKAIKKSGQEISGSKTKKPQQQPQQARKPPLNPRGPVGYQPRSTIHQAGPRYTYKKPIPRAQPASQPQKYTQNKAPPRVTNSRN